MHVWNNFDEVKTFQWMSNEKYGIWWKIYGNFDKYTFILIAYHVLTQRFYHILTVTFHFTFAFFFLSMDAIELRHGESCFRNVYFDIDLVTILPLAMRKNLVYERFWCFQIKRKLHKLCGYFFCELFDLFKNPLTHLTKTLNWLFRKNLVGSVHHWIEKMLPCLWIQDFSNDVGMSEWMRLVPLFNMHFMKNISGTHFYCLNLFLLKFTNKNIYSQYFQDETAYSFSFMFRSVRMRMDYGLANSMEKMCSKSEVTPFSSWHLYDLRVYD